MKPHRSFVIFSPPGGWRIGVAAGGESRLVPVATESEEPAHVAGALAGSLRSAGHAGEAVLLALGSGQCLSATVPTAGLPRRGRHQAALYRLEERLPLAAEDLSADFLFHNGTAMGVCTRADDLRPLAESLAAQRIDVTAACPTAILSFSGARLEPGGATLLEADALAWQIGARIEIFRLKNSTPVAWLDVPAEGDDVALALAAQVIARKAPIRIATVNLNDGLLAELAELPDVTVVGRATLAMDEVALRAAARVLRGDEQPPLDLLGGGMGRHAVRQLRLPLVAMAGAVGLLCVGLILACWIRGARYAAAAARADDRRAAAFRQLFPREPLPVGIESRLRAVQLQLRGANRAEQAGGTDAGGTPDALSSLHDLLSNLPTDARYRINELDLDGGRLSLRGEVSTHGDADAVATALRRARQFTIDDPQTQQLEGSAVRFSISGTVHSATPEPGPRRAP
jgi:hypothetical protein